MSTENFYSDWLNLEVPVGVEFVLNGVRLKSVEKYECGGCLFFKEENGVKVCTQIDTFKRSFNMICHFTKRKDGKTVIFKEV